MTHNQWLSFLIFYKNLNLWIFLCGLTFCLGCDKTKFNYLSYFRDFADGIRVSEYFSDNFFNRAGGYPLVFYGVSGRHRVGVVDGLKNG